MIYLYGAHLQDWIGLAVIAAVTVFLIRSEVKHHRRLKREAIWRRVTEADVTGRAKAMR